MKQEDVHPGLVLRLINPRTVNAPRGTLATVETVGTSPAGDWLCTVRYHEKRESSRPRLYRSHLWKNDLACFEIVNDVQRAEANQVSKAEAKREAKRAQLRLPLDDGTFP